MISSITPFLKWAGGKRQLLSCIKGHLPKNWNRYYEPFVGGGALLFHLQPELAVINDINTELINTYIAVKDFPAELIESLKKHPNDKNYYYRMRNLDRCCDSYKMLSDLERASRMIYLNRTCYNGLYRVNSSGQFNVPFGSYKNPKIVNEPVINAVSDYLNKSGVEIAAVDYAEAVEKAGEGDFVYFDPPYDPLSGTSSFTGYVAGGFGKSQQQRLADLYRELGRKGCQLMLSNSSTDFIKELYADYKILTVPANRSLNSVSSSRGAVDELLVINY